MIWLKLFLMGFVVASAKSGSHRETYLIYVVDDGANFYFYKMDVDFEEKVFLLEVYHEGKSLDNFFIVKNKTNNDVLYYSLKHSTKIGTYIIERGKKVERNFGDAGWNGIVFLGPSNDGKLFFYNPDYGFIHSYEFDTKKSSAFDQKMETVVDSVGEKQCFAKNPHKELANFFVKCSETNKTGNVYDIKEQKVLESDVQLPKCFDQCSITPDGTKTFGLIGNELYVHSSKDSEFVSYYNFGNDEVTKFAAGNNEIFYTKKDKDETSNNKLITKVNNIIRGKRRLSTYFVVKGEVVALLVY